MVSISEIKNCNDRASVMRGFLILAGFCTNTDEFVATLKTLGFDCDSFEEFREPWILASSIVSSLCCLVSICMGCCDGIGSLGEEENKKQRVFMGFLLTANLLAFIGSIILIVDKDSECNTTSTLEKTGDYLMAASTAVYPMLSQLFTGGGVSSSSSSRSPSLITNQ